MPSASGFPDPPAGLNGYCCLVTHTITHGPFINMHARMGRITKQRLLFRVGANDLELI